MRTSIFILLMSMVISTFGQNLSMTFTFRNKIYFITSEKLESDAFKFTIAESNANKSDFTIKPLKEETFKVGFINAITTLIHDGSLSVSENSQIEDKAKDIFYNIITESLKKSLSDAPFAGKLTIKKTVVLHWYKDPQKGRDGRSDSVNAGNDSILRSVLIKEIEIEFYEGYIETIKVIGEQRINDSIFTYRFENKFGIGFTSRKNYRLLYYINLYDTKTDWYYYISAGDLLDYDYRVKQMTKDYSPANQIINSFGGESVELKKEEKSKLFEAIVYSDFLGINKDNPNGLIQTEVSKRINVHSYIFQGSHHKPWNSIIRGTGFFQYIKPAITISKIEENNRYLQPSSHDTIYSTNQGKDSLVQKSISSPIKILQYENISLGIDLNILFQENPDLKYHFYLNGGFRFGRTSIRDSLRKLDSQNNIVNSGIVDEYNISYFTFYPEFVLQFLPEERFGVIISDKIQYFLSAFDNPELKTMNKESQFTSHIEKWINSIEALVFVKTGENGKLFARWRFNNQIGNINENFNQIQVGYSFYILKKN